MDFGLRVVEDKEKLRRCDEKNKNKQHVLIKEVEDVFVIEEGRDCEEEARMILMSKMSLSI